MCAGFAPSRAAGWLAPGWQAGEPAAPRWQPKHPCCPPSSQVPYFNAPIFLENKTQIGKVDEIFGQINNVVRRRSLVDGGDGRGMGSSDAGAPGPRRMERCVMGHDSMRKAWFHSLLHPGPCAVLYGENERRRCCHVVQQG